MHILLARHARVKRNVFLLRLFQGLFLLRVVHKDTDD